MFCLNRDFDKISLNYDFYSTEIKASLNPPSEGKWARLITLRPYIPRLFPLRGFVGYSGLLRFACNDVPKTSPNPSEGGEQTTIVGTWRAASPYKPSLFPPFGLTLPENFQKIQKKVLSLHFS